MTDEIRKRRRMQSNRESAQRSRMRKQKHLADLTAEIALLRSNNGQIFATLQVTTQQCLSVEADNSVLRAQFAELTNRLDSLNGILTFFNGAGVEAGGSAAVESHWGFVSQQPIVASADCHVFGY